MAHKKQTIDHIDDFILVSELNFSEMVIYNYARKFKDKAVIFGHARRFIGNSTSRVAYENLISMKILKEVGDVVSVIYNPETNIVPLDVTLGSGRPVKNKITI